MVLVGSMVSWLADTLEHVLRRSCPRNNSRGWRHSHVLFHPKEYIGGINASVRRRMRQFEDMFKSNVASLNASWQD
jgi:hypothetical protein